MRTYKNYENLYWLVKTLKRNTVILLPEECCCQTPCRVMSGLQNCIRSIPEGCDLADTISNILVHRVLKKNISLFYKHPTWRRGWGGQDETAWGEKCFQMCWSGQVALEEPSIVFLFLEVAGSYPGGCRYLDCPKANAFWCGTMIKLESNGVFLASTPGLGKADMFSFLIS